MRAYYAFSLLIQLADSFKFLSSNMILTIGWKNSWLVIGGSGVVMGLLIILTTPNVDKNNDKPSNDQTRPLESSGFMFMLRKYKRHFGMMFSTYAANMVLIACFLRLV